MIKDKALDGAVALVTGGSRGIGRAACVALANRGAHVVINYRSGEDAARETAAACEAAGAKASLAPFDVADRDAAPNGVQKVAKDHGLDILVNNAGIAINGLLMRFKDADWDKLMEVNLGGIFMCTRAANRYLLKAKERGRIINMSSVVGEMGNGGQAAYAASKAAIIGFTKSMARELAGRQITCNAIAPGYIATDMTNAELPDEARAKLLAQIPLGRIGEASEIGDAVAFLAGPEAAYITGQVLRINGGLLM
jgi:3-oxoacyl-[acyl-carrier protein] reductase